jgi:hypothetical protein
MAREITYCSSRDIADNEVPFAGGTKPPRHLLIWNRIVKTLLSFAVLRDFKYTGNSLLINTLLGNLRKPLDNVFTLIKETKILLKEKSELWR